MESGWEETYEWYDKVTPSSTPQRLLDEDEHLGRMRWENYEYLKDRQFGLQTELTANSFKEDGTRLASYRFNMLFRKLIPSSEFDNVLNDPVYWGQNQAWRKTWRRFSGPRGRVVKFKFRHNGQEVAASTFLGGVLSHVETPTYDNDVQVQRTSQMLRSELECFCKLGILAIVYEIKELPNRIDKMEYILCILLESLRVVQLREENRCTLILKFHIRNDNESSGCLSWFRRFRQSVNGWTNLKPALRLFSDLPSKDSISSWLQDAPSFVFISKDMFKINAYNAPFLDDALRLVLVTFLEERARIIVQDIDDLDADGKDPSGRHLSYYKDSLHFIWRNFLLYRV